MKIETANSKKVVKKLKLNTLKSEIKKNKFAYKLVLPAIIAMIIIHLYL